MLESSKTTRNKRHLNAWQSNAKHSRLEKSGKNMSRWHLDHKPYSSGKKSATEK